MLVSLLCSVYSYSDVYTCRICLANTLCKDNIHVMFIIIAQNMLIHLLIRLIMLICLLP